MAKDLLGLGQKTPDSAWCVCKCRHSRSGVVDGVGKENIRAAQFDSWGESWECHSKKFNINSVIKMRKQCTFHT